MSRALPVFLALVGSLPGSHQTIPSSGQGVPERTAQFRAALAEVPMPLLVDLAGVETVPAHLGKTGATIEGVRVLAASLRRQLVEVGDALVFAQSLEPGLGTRRRERLMMEWLAEEKPDLVNRLKDSPVDLREANPKGRLALAGFLSTMEALVYKLAAGDPVLMKLAPAMMAYATDPVTGRRLPGFASLTVGATYDTLFPDYHAPDDPTPLLSTPLAKVDDGDLDFGAGEVLPLQEVMDRAFALWKCRYRADARFLTQPVFVKGEFTRNRLDETLKRLCEPIRYREIPGGEDPVAIAERQREALYRELVDRAAPGLKDLYERARQGPYSITVDELIRRNPGWSDELLKGLRAPRDATIRIERFTIRATFGGDPSTVPKEVKGPLSAAIHF